MDFNKPDTTDQTKILSITIMGTCTESVTPVIIAGMLGTMKAINGVRFTELTIETRKRRLRKSGPQKESGSESP
jgi:hypothetical protein